MAASREDAMYEVKDMPTRFRDSRFGVWLAALVNPWNPYNSYNHLDVAPTTFGGLMALVINAVKS